MSAIGADLIKDPKAKHKQRSELNVFSCLQLKAIYPITEYDQADDEDKIPHIIMSMLGCYMSEMRSNQKQSKYASVD